MASTFLCNIFLFISVQAQYTQPIGDLSFILNGPIYLPNHPTPDDQIQYIPDIEIEFDIFLHSNHNSNAPRIDYQVLNVGLPSDYANELPKLMLASDTSHCCTPGSWFFSWDNPTGYPSASNGYLYWGSDSVSLTLPIGEWTHIYTRANKYGQYFEQDGNGYLNPAISTVLDLENLIPSQTLGIYIGGDTSRSAANATIQNLRIYSVPAPLTTILTTRPTSEPSQSPQKIPTSDPTDAPTLDPTNVPSVDPTTIPSC